jgi:hypothetical protein
MKCPRREKLPVLVGEGQNLRGDPAGDVEGAEHPRVGVGQPEPAAEHPREVPPTVGHLLRRSPERLLIHQQEDTLLRGDHVCRAPEAVGEAHLTYHLAWTQHGQDHLRDVGTGSAHFGTDEADDVNDFAGLVGGNDARSGGEGSLVQQGSELFEFLWDQAAEEVYPGEDGGLQSGWLASRAPLVRVDQATPAPSPSA